MAKEMGARGRSCSGCVGYCCAGARAVGGHLASTGFPSWEQQQKQKQNGARDATTTLHVGSLCRFPPRAQF